MNNLKFSWLFFFSCQHKYNNSISFLQSFEEFWFLETFFCFFSFFESFGAFYFFKPYFLVEPQVTALMTLRLRGMLEWVNKLKVAHKQSWLAMSGFQFCFCGSWAHTRWSVCHMAWFIKWDFNKLKVDVDVAHSNSVVVEYGSLELSWRKETLHWDLSTENISWNALKLYTSES